jgi:hypothetical protein
MKSRFVRETASYLSSFLFTDGLALELFETINGKKRIN